MIRPRVGYIKLDSFAETTGQELRDALKKLRDELRKGDAKDFDGLVFDLRKNPGGLLQEAIEVSETFLQAMACISSRSSTHRWPVFLVRSTSAARMQMESCSQARSQARSST